MSKTSKENKPTPAVVTPRDLADLVVQLADDKKAEDVVSLEMSELSTIADYYVICAGTSGPHIKAIAGGVSRGIRAGIGKRPRSVEGDPASEWVVIDFNSVVLHVMSPKTRELYQLESLWGDAPKIDAVRELEKKAPKRQ